MWALSLRLCRAISAAPQPRLSQLRIPAGQSSELLLPWVQGAQGAQDPPQPGTAQGTLQGRASLAGEGKGTQEQLWEMAPDAHRAPWCQRGSVGSPWWGGVGTDPPADPGGLCRLSHTNPRGSLGMCRDPPGLALPAQKPQTSSTLLPVHPAQLLLLQLFITQQEELGTGLALKCLILGCSAKVGEQHQPWSCAGNASSPGLLCLCSLAQPRLGHLGLCLTPEHHPGGIHPIPALGPPLPNRANPSTESLCSSGTGADYFQKQFLLSDGSVLGCPEIQGYLTPKGDTKPGPEHLLPLVKYCCKLHSHSCSHCGQTLTLYVQTWTQTPHLALRLQCLTHQKEDFTGNFCIFSSSHDF